MSKTALPAATKLTPQIHKQASKVAEKTGLRIADLLRIGLSRVIDEHARTGKITLSSKP